MAVSLFPFPKLSQDSCLSCFLDDEDDIFKPPKLTDEDFTPFGSKGGLFSGGTGLFDDDEVRMLERVQMEMCFTFRTKQTNKNHQKNPTNSQQLWKAERRNNILFLDNFKYNGTVYLSVGQSVSFCWTKKAM